MIERQVMMVMVAMRSMKRKNLCQYVLHLEKLQYQYVLRTQYVPRRYMELPVLTVSVRTQYSVLLSAPVCGP